MKGILIVAACVVLLIVIVAGVEKASFKPKPVRGEILAGAGKSLRDLGGRVVTGGYVEVYASAQSQNPLRRVTFPAGVPTRVDPANLENQLGHGWFVYTVSVARAERYSWGTIPWGQWTESTDRENYSRGYKHEHVHGHAHHAHRDDREERDDHDDHDHHDDHDDHDHHDRDDDRDDHDDEHENDKIRYRDSAKNRRLYSEPRQYRTVRHAAGAGDA